MAESETVFNHDGHGLRNSSVSPKLDELCLCSETYKVIRHVIYGRKFAFTLSLLQLGFVINSFVDSVIGSAHCHLFDFCYETLSVNIL